MLQTNTNTATAKTKPDLFSHTQYNSSISRDVPQYKGYVIFRCQMNQLGPLQAHSKCCAGPSFHIKER